MGSSYQERCRSFPFVALPPSEDMFACAKHLFGSATVSTQGMAPPFASASAVRGRSLFLVR